MTAGDPDRGERVTREDGAAPRRASPFREQALRHREAVRDEGSVLLLTPLWTRWSFWLIVAMALATILVLVLGRVTEYAEGPAFVQADDAVVVTSAVSGVVADVYVEPGQRVEAGELLARLGDENEAAELARLRRAFEGRLLERLRDPDDAAAAAALVGLRPEIELAERRVAQRSFRAPRAGIVNDVRARAGLAVSAGSPIVGLAPESGRHTIIALVPGHHRPSLAPGARMRVEMDGYRYAYRWITVESVSDRVVGPAEARRFAGPDVGDTLALDGPVVFVRASLPDGQFEARGRSVSYYHGMRARAEIPVRRERLLFAVAPWLRALAGKADHE